VIQNIQLAEAVLKRVKICKITNVDSMQIFPDSSDSLRFNLAGRNFPLPLSRSWGDLRYKNEMTKVD
jgi:hypothetical protein